MCDCCGGDEEGGARESLCQLREDLSRQTRELEARVSGIAGQHGTVHPGLVGAALARRELQARLGLLWLAASRYGPRHVWCSLDRLLGPLLREARENLALLDRDLWTPPPPAALCFPLLDNFLDRFWEEVDPHFRGFEKRTPFVAGLVSTLTVVPCGTLELSVWRSGGTLRCGLEEVAWDLLPEVGEGRTRGENERSLLEYLWRRARLATRQRVQREAATWRRDQLACGPGLRHLLAFLAAGDERALRHCLSPHGETYSIPGLVPTPGLLCSWRQAPYGLRDNCAACPCSVVVTAFEMEISKIKKNPYLTEESLVLYDPDTDNYSLITKEHWNL